MKEDAIWEKLSVHSVLPLHMPGHKRNVALAPYLEKLGAALDVSEIAGFDDLHAPTGIIKDSMCRAARLWESEATFFSVNGSTGGLLAGIGAATKRGDRVLVARNCHKAVYHALELFDLSPVFLVPPLVGDIGIAGSLQPEAVASALAAEADIRLVILTSPTYEGVISDVAKICQIAHGYDIPVLVDEAHGAHLGFHATFPHGAVAAGADIVVQSLHKTLPSLTQTAVVQANGSRIDRGELARRLAIFQSSSPSYLLLASIDGCVRLVEDEGAVLFPRWSELLSDFVRETAQLSHLSIFGQGEITADVYALDPSKIVISTRNSSLTGDELLKLLRERYQLELEMSLPNYAVAMTGLGDDGVALRRLAQALCELDAEFGHGVKVETIAAPSGIPQRRVSLADAAEYPWQLVSLSDAVGLVSGAYIWAYPPGIPLITPGEVVDEAFVLQLKEMCRMDVHILGTRGALPEQIAVLQV